MQLAQRLILNLPEETLQTLADSGSWQPDPVTATYGLLLNTKVEPFTDPNVRLALRLATDTQAVVEAARKSGAPLVGLSALMTTTVESMEKTIRLLREKANVKIVVGGAVLTEDYAMQIGADFYARDAMATVRAAERVFGEE